jgi:ABC-type sugar transport system permease subunit
MELGLIEFPVAWLSTSAGAMSAVVITKVWLSVPLFMSFFLAGLASMDREQLEAARVDGAGNFRVIKDHILPHLRPVLLVTVVLGMIGNLQHFDTIWAEARCARHRYFRSRSTVVRSSSGIWEWLRHSASCGCSPSCHRPISTCAN